ncbi:MAG: SurA N-terminal domain-containing protein [Porticoccaceae bacterium]
MLQDFRERIKGVALWLVVLIAIPFVFFGVDSFFTGGAATDAAVSVNGEKITKLELERAIAIQRQTLLSQKDGLDPELLDDDQLRGPVQQGLIREKVMEQAARARHLAVAPQTLAEILRNESAFHSDGRFDKARYEFVLRQMGYSPQTYNALLQNKLLVGQLAAGVSGTGFATVWEVQLLLELLEQRRNFAYLIIPVAPVISQIGVSDQESKTFYDDNQSFFQAEEQVVVDYLEIKPDELLRDITITEEDVRKQYADEVAKHVIGERRHVAHILVAPKADNSHQKTLAEIGKKIADGEGFGKLASAYSEDSGSAGQGGDVGFVEPGAFPEQFEKVVAQLKVGEVSAPVKTESGLHLIKLLELQAAPKLSFEQEKDRIKRELQQAQVAELLPEKVSQLKELTYNAENLADVGKTLGLPVRVSKPFSRIGGDGVAAFPAVVAAAFSEGVLENRYASDVLELADGSMVVLKVRQHLPATIMPLADVRPQIVEKLKADKARVLLDGRANAIAKRIRNGESVGDVAKSEKLQWQISVDTKRFADGVNPELRDKAFALPATGSLPAVDTLVTSGGDHIVLALLAIEPGDGKQLSADERGRLEQSTLRSLAGRDYKAYEALVVADAKIVSKD